MHASWPGVIELLFVFGVALAWGVYELHSVRRKPDDDKDNEPGDAP